MSIVQSPWGGQRRQAPVSAEAGGVVCEKYRYTIPAGTNLAVNDIIELAVLPAYHTVVNAILITDALATTTIDVGIMSGTVGSPDQARTCGNELFAAAANGSVVRNSKPEGFRIVPIEGDRSIGLKVLTAGVTGAGQFIELVLFTKQ